MPGEAYCNAQVYPGSGLLIKTDFAYTESLTSRASTVVLALLTSSNSLCYCYSISELSIHWHKNSEHDVCQILKTPLDGDVFSRCPHLLALTDVLKFLMSVLTFDDCTL